MLEIVGGQAEYMSRIVSDLIMLARGDDDLNLEVSRTPLREVFRDLAGEGYLTLRAGRGVRVTELSHTTLRSFFQSAPMIYGAILQLAALNARPHQIDQLKAGFAACITP